MVIPLLPIAAGIGGTFLGGALATWFGSGQTKKEMTTAASQGTVTNIQPYAYYSPTTNDSRQLSFVNNPQIQIASPNSNQESTATTKKEDTISQTPSFYPSISQTPTVTSGQSDTPSAMSDFMPVILIAAAGLVAIAVIK